MKSGIKVLAAFLAGAAAGATIGLLLAPDKGSETRKKIKEKISDLSEKAKNFTKKVQNEE
jgi:gas vesicle protein